MNSLPYILEGSGEDYYYYNNNKVNVKCYLGDKQGKIKTLNIFRGLNKNNDQIKLFIKILTYQYQFNLKSMILEFTKEENVIYNDEYIEKESLEYAFILKISFDSSSKNYDNGFKIQYKIPGVRTIGYRDFLTGKQKNKLRVKSYEIS